MLKPLVKHTAYREDAYALVKKVNHHIVLLNSRFAVKVEQWIQLEE